MAISFCLTPALGMDRGRVEAIVDSLKAATGQGIRVVVEDSNKPDAYLHPMGHIVITTGLMGLFEDDAEMAFVIGHEMAHAVMGHYDGSSDQLGLSRDVRLPDGLRKEIEADSYGLKIMKAAGYDPAAFMRVFAKVKEGHPSIEKRINALNSRN